MKRRTLLGIVGILMVLVTVAHAQQILPDWTEITAGVFFKTDPTLIQPAQPDAMMYWLSLAGTNRIVGAAALHQALLQLRALHPEEFDQVLMDNHLTVDLAH